MKNKLFIYIIGDGRSGSTILEEYLAQELGGLKIGEARRFWFRYYEAKTCCECGDEIENCIFWNKVESHLPSDLCNGEIHNDINNNLNYNKTRSVIRNKIPNNRIKEIQQHFYNAIEVSTDKKLIIDSSKIYSWGINLDLWNGERVLFIHLVRNIKDVGNSWKKDLILPEYRNIHVKMPKRSLNQHLRSWFKTNIITLRHFSNRNNYIYVDYKDFCENPASLIELIKYHPVLKDIKFDSETEAHGIGGNPVRKNTSGNLNIKYNSSDKNLNIFEKITYLLGWKIYSFIKQKHVR